jgi:hypothetical protein
MTSLNVQIALVKGVVASIVEDRREELVVVLMKAVEPRLKIILRYVRAETNLSPGVRGGMVIGSGDREISSRAVVVRAVAVVKR